MLLLSEMYVCSVCGTSLLKSNFFKLIKAGELNFAVNYFAGLFFCGHLFLRIEVNPQNPQKLEPAKFSCYSVIKYSEASLSSVSLSQSLPLHRSESSETSIVFSQLSIL